MSTGYLSRLSIGLAATLLAVSVPLAQGPAPTVPQDNAPTAAGPQGEIGRAHV